MGAAGALLLDPVIVGSACGVQNEGLEQRGLRDNLMLGSCVGSGLSFIALISGYNS
jgi:hypothetical protein